VRKETADGLIATGSELRFRAVPYATPEDQRRALAQIKRLDEHIVRLQDLLKETRNQIDQARAEFSKQSGKLENRLKAARQAYAKAKGDLQRRIDQQKKKDTDRLTEERRKIDQEFKSADDAMVKRLAAEKPKKRNSMLKAFRRQQAQVRKKREQSLEAERSRLEQQWRKELADFDTREMWKLKSLEVDCQKGARQVKARLDQATVRWKAHSKGLDKASSQRAAVLGEHGSSETWRHVIQPAWSLDALRVPFHRIRMRWSFVPGRVPLSRVHPTTSVAPPLLPWRVDRNSQGQWLHSGGQQYGWGFGVHAYSELSFTLPQYATSFQARLGLDRIVDTGGCVRARVFLGSTTEKPVYASGLLIGSTKTVATGSIAIGAPANGPKRLILQADMAHRDRPPGTDPLNIRDKLDWLDPVIGLERPGFRMRSIAKPSSSYTPGRDGR